MTHDASCLPDVNLYKLSAAPFTFPSYLKRSERGVSSIGYSSRRWSVS